MAKIYLALGSNVGDRLSNIKNAISLLKGNVSSIKLSKIYETKPVGYTDQGNFINAAIEGRTALSPDALLAFTQKVEIDVGRIRRFRWGPREIDIDILFYDDLVYHDQKLEIPHPRLQERDFVLKPLIDLNPKLMHPLYKKTVKQLYDQLPKKELSIIDAKE